MTDQLFSSVEGHALSEITVTVPNVGPWRAECEFVEAPELAGAVTIKLGTLELRGTVEPQLEGSFALRGRAVIVAGAGGWGHAVTAQGYHNDARIKARLVAEDAARAVGEVIGTFVPANERIGVDYVRQAGPAARALEDAIGLEVAWWVDYAGLTNVGPRPAVSIADSAYTVLAFDPSARIVTLAVDDPGAVGIGSLLSTRLDVPQVVREFELRITTDEIRVKAWTGGTETSRSRVAALMRSIARRATDAELHGVYQYRVVRMATDGRVELQAVRRSVGLPDLLPVRMWPGVAGAHAELEPSAEVLVSFIEGDRTRPIISHFTGKDGAAWIPVSLALCGGVQAVARQGDLVQSGGPGTLCTLTPVPPAIPAPPNGAVVCGAPYFISFGSVPGVGPTQAPLYGAISTGSPKVRA
jgi:hypothetical protein